MPALPDPSSIDALIEEAIDHYAAARLSHVDRICNLVLSAAPTHSRALRLIGLSALRGERFAEAIEAFNKASLVDPTDPDIVFHRAIAQLSLRRWDEAAASFRRVLQLRPHAIPALYNLGTALRAIGDLDGAVLAYQEVVRIDPSLADAHLALANTLCDMGQHSQAVVSYRRTLELELRTADAYNNFGTALAALEDWSGAIAAYTAAIAIQPERAGTYFNLGNALRSKGSIDDALASYEEAITRQPDFAAAHVAIGAAELSRGNPLHAAKSAANAISTSATFADAHHLLGGALQELGQPNAALDSYTIAISQDEAPEFKRSIARCIAAAGVVEISPRFRNLITRAIGEAWGRPRDLAWVGTQVAMRSGLLNAVANRALIQWRAQESTREVLTTDELRELSGDHLLGALLVSAPVCTVALERLLTLARRTLLLTTFTSPCDRSEPNGFFCSIARQCYVNEFVFACSDEEESMLAELKATVARSLSEDADVPAAAVVTLGCYGQLVDLSLKSKLLERPWQPSIVQIIQDQMVEPQREDALRESLIHITPIDAASTLVRKQYEENPYPRWTRCARPTKARDITSLIRRDNRLAPIAASAADEAKQILIAGCGTGQEAIEAALQFPDALITAVDLSASSLAYAMRKATELSVTNISFAQADILHLGTQSATFDLVSSVGVLHHLDDPFRGLEVLVSLTRPAGFIRLGFYSAYGRRKLNQARAAISDERDEISTRRIRTLRQELIESHPSVTSFADFFATSECRDLLFHVQERQMTLPAIAEMLNRLDLTFLGFSLDSSVISEYRRTYPIDPTATNLDYWNEYEVQRPSTFRSMYQFWTQRQS